MTSALKSGRNIDHFVACAAIAGASLGLAANPASADLLSAVGATTDMGAGFGTDLVNTINGVGLSSIDLNALHDPTIPSNSWVSTVGTTTGQVTFSLGGSFLIDGFSFWNQNGGGPGLAGSTGINGVSVLGSTDGLLFTPIAGAPSSFAQQPSIVPVGPEVVSFGAVAVSHIRFQISSNWGDVQVTGFAEVQFSEVPAPGALALLGLAGLVGQRRRRA